MKILFVGAFDRENRSTNNSQSRGFTAAGAEVYEYPHRDRCHVLGQKRMEAEIMSIAHELTPDLIVFAKWPDNTSIETFEKLCNDHSTCFWWMDPISSLNEKQFLGMSLCDFVAVAWANTIASIRKHNNEVFLAHEGFDHLVDKPHSVDKKFDVSFIGSLHSDRYAFLSKVKHEIIHVAGAYSHQHANVVSMTKINIGISTNGSSSDRVFKVLAAGGFLLTDDWVGREAMFEDGKHLVIYNGVDDLDNKLKFYLSNDGARNEIASAGCSEVQKYNRDVWAKEIIRIHEFIKKKSV